MKHSQWQETAFFGLIPQMKKKTNQQTLKQRHKSHQLSILNILITIKQNEKSHLLSSNNLLEPRLKENLMVSQPCWNSISAIASQLHLANSSQDWQWQFRKRFAEEHLKDGPKYLSVEKLKFILLLQHPNQSHVSLY